MPSSIPEIGSLAPDFQVKTSEGEEFRLYSALKSGRNIMLVFYRGHW